jgi:6-pyruvoyltetrahydropterin 2'-reductase
MSIKVSEIFRSIQGEGDMTGRLSIWVRFFGCNLRCEGFYQDNPTDPSTYKKTIVDWTKVNKMEDLPVFEYGCDSEYSWHPDYKKLVTTYKDAGALVEALRPFLYEGGKWEHPVTENMIDLCFTGGEPMLQQKAIVDIMREIKVEEREITVQVETNGTKPLKQDLLDYVVNGRHEHKLHFNISPKLYNVSGEKNAVKYENIFQYQELTTSGILKFVVNNNDATWDELNTHVKKLRDMGVWLPVYVMPVGATKEQQEDSDTIAAISSRAIDNGYHVSGRLHCNIFGNIMGV